MSANELLLLGWRERHHAELAVVVQCREDPIIDAEVRMAHVRAFHGVLHAQRNPAKVIRAHGGQACRRPSAHDTAYQIVAAASRRHSCKDPIAASKAVAFSNPASTTVVRALLITPIRFSK